MIYTVLIVVMAVLAAYAGGSLPGADRLDREYTIRLGNWFQYRFNLTWLPEFLFTLGIALAAGIVYMGLFWPLALIWSYLWMQTGIGVVLGWGDPRAADANPHRCQTLSPVVDWLAVKLRIPLTLGDPQNSPTRNYCRLFMMVKGFFIGLPLGGVPLAILWPLAYEIGARLRPLRYSHTIAELLTGAATALQIIILWELFA